MTGYYYIYGPELYHHGVKGMKWGVRRTPAQLGHPVSKKRRSVFKKAAKGANSIGNRISSSRQNAHDKKIEKIVRSGDIKKIYKNRKKLNDKQIKDALNRVDTTRKLKDLDRSPTSKYLEKGRAAVADASLSAGKTVLTTLMVGTALYSAKNQINKRYGADAANFIIGKKGGIKNTNNIKRVQKIRSAAGRYGRSGNRYKRMR